MFILKKLFGALLLPLPLLLILLAGGTILLWRNKRSRTGRWLVTIGIVLLAALSFRPIPVELGRTLERQYPPYSPDAGAPTPELVVVLGGGSGDDHTLPAPSRLSAASLSRLVEGIRIVSMHPESHLVLSGGTGFNRTAEADVMAAAARALSVDSSRIVIESTSRDTEEQAQLLKEIIGGRRFVLVTSAVHMPRTTALFRKQGMDPIPAPAGHRFDRSFYTGPRALVPSAEHLRSMDSVLHEYYGLVWSWARGRI